MSATPPEANTEYSRGQGPSRDQQAPFPDGSSGARAVARTARLAFVAAALTGAALLGVAELMPLLHVRVAAGSLPRGTVLTGPHHGYALLPIAALSTVLTIVALRQESRAALVALAALGLVTLAIALLSDLPDARATGLVGSSATRFVQAGSSPAAGLYLESLGAVLLLLGAGLGLLLLGPAQDSQRRIPWFGS